MNEHVSRCEQGMEWRGFAPVAAVVLGLAAADCDPPQAERSDGPGATEERESAVEAGTDDRSRGRAGVELEVERSAGLPEDPERIVSLAPNVTETLFAVGAGDRLVGVTKYCTYPEEAKAIRSVGSFANPDFETILGREPDLVLGTISGGPRSLFEQLRRTDIPYAFVDMSTIREVYAGIRRIGAFAGHAEEARRLSAEMQGRVRAFESRWGGREGDDPRVLLVHGHEPLVAAGPDSFGDQLLRRSGVRNVLEDAGTSYPRIDFEKVLDLDPDRILDTAADDAESGREFWGRRDTLRAVRNGDVHVLSDPVVLRPGPRLPEALRRVARAAHGEPPEPGDEGEAGP